MRAIKFAARWILIGLVLFVLGNGVGYLARTYECRTDRQTVYIAKPGVHPVDAVDAGQLHAITVSRCTLPANWGGYGDRINFDTHSGAAQ